MKLLECCFVLCSLIFPVLANNNKEESHMTQPKMDCEHVLDCPVNMICEKTKCVNRCRSDEDCRLEEACINGVCQDPCSVYGACGHNAICRAKNHNRVCSCEPGYSGKCNQGQINRSDGDNSELLRVCYYPVDKDNLTPSKLNTSLCTHIIAGFSSVEDGVINLGDDTKKQLYRETTSLKKKNPKLKVLLTIGGGGNNSGFSPAYNSTFNRTRFIASTLAILDEYDFDGLDVDWEFPVWNDACPEDKNNFVSFLEEFYLLSKAYAYLMGKDQAILSVAVAAPVNIVQSSYNISEMAKYVTFINLMTYDFHDFNWYTPFTGHNSPLFKRSAEKAYFATLNTAWVANFWFEQGMPKSKIMVGIPTYGHSYKLVNKNFNGVDAPSSGTNGDVTFTQVCQTLKAGGTRVFDKESRVPYAYLDYDWMSYEDSESMYEKANWIKSQGFGGAMTYDLNADDWPSLCDKTPFLLHRILYEVFTS